MRMLLQDAVNYLKGEPNELAKEKLVSRIEAEIHERPEADGK